MARVAKKAAPRKAAKPASARKVVEAGKAAAGKTTAAKAPGKATVVAKAPSAAKPEPKAAPPAPPAPKKRKPVSIPPAELAAIRKELEDQRALYRRELAELEAGTFNQSQSDLSGEVSFDEESADAGTFTFERERDLSLGNNIRDLLDKVDAALRRIDAGTYGTCERCGRAIDKARLRALPYSVLCIDCKKLEERIR